ncbi:MAG: hypothetical protein AAB011_04040, partial [Candidatus Eisenbacteria bacterium]
MVDRRRSRSRSVARWIALLAGVVLFMVALAATAVAAPPADGGFIQGARILVPDHLRLQLAGPAPALDPATVEPVIGSNYPA